MNHNQTRLGRRSMLKKGTALVASLATLGISRAPAAAGKMAKGDFYYQSTPKDGNKCVDCAVYIPQPGAAEGACKVVEGPINPNGWCMAFSPKPMRAS